jgi:hypothetical protein
MDTISESPTTLYIALGHHKHLKTVIEMTRIESAFALLLLAGRAFS